MRVVITHHGSLPGPSAPVTGGALRARQHRLALQAAGHDVVLITRFQDDPAGFRGPSDLRSRVRSLAPDRIVCVQPEDASALTDLDVPTAVDLYAPRLLESAFEGTLNTTTAMVFGALNAGDVFLTSNRRQQWSWRSVMALAGFDPSEDPTRLVPLAAPSGVTHHAAPRTPLFVAGGARWPWQDPGPALARVLAHLDKRGKGQVAWYGGAPLIGRVDGGWDLPEHPRLSTPGWLPYDALLEAYARATAAIDWQGHNPERGLALSFRHVDYLGAGLPILTGPDSALVDLLGSAGIATDDIEGALDTVLDNKKSRARMRSAARSLAADQFTIEACGAQLVDWVSAGTRHTRSPGPLSQTAEWIRRAEQAQASAKSAAEALERARSEVAAKRAQHTALTHQVHSLTDTVARQARALDEVAGFKREAIQLLGNEGDRARRTAEDLARENALLTADVEKKSAELRAMDDLRTRLEHDLTNLRAELERMRTSRGWLRRS